MPSSLAADLLTLAGTIALAVVFIWAIRARRRSHKHYLEETADTEVCDHLRPAFKLLRSRGHRVTNIGQRSPELPLEIHLAPPFDPSSVFDELKLAEPVFVSERNVLYCKKDWCELHPIGRA
jgi:hypothetical protein